MGPRLRRPPRPSPADLRGRLIPLASLEPGTDHADLDRWVTSLAGVRVFGLGEATHGTHEFFTLRHRLLAELIRRHDVTVLALEADVGGCRELDRYVTTGDGDPTRDLRDLGWWTWNTEEMLHVLRALREHNARVPDQRVVRITGVDPNDRRRRRSDPRDRAMAEAVLELIERHPTVRMAWWAHNGHVGADYVTGRARAAGHWLRERLGSAYHPLACTFHHGAFQALRLTPRGLHGPVEFTVPPPPPARSVEGVLADAAPGDLLLDLRHSDSDPIFHAWAGKPRGLHTYGSIMTPARVAPHCTTRIVPARCFDTIALVQRMTRAHPVPPS